MFCLRNGPRHAVRQKSLYLRTTSGGLDTEFQMGFSSRMKDMWHDPKQRVAMSSVIAAVFLVLFKLYVGIITNSLGILSEALHSGLDLVAAAITVIAVYSSAKPADEDHPFGHGKAENFSALVESLLLLLTCVWIFWEAAKRITSGEMDVDTSDLAFASMMLVMIVSIIINISRARALYRAAEKYHSQALEADALHFSSDILSSAVVIVGLIFVKLGFPLGDPIAAVIVGIVIIYATVKLGLRTMDYLMDKAPEGKIDQIRMKVEALDGVRCERVRARTSGPYAFVDVRISLDRNMPLDLSKDIVKNVESCVRDVMDNADVVVYIEPQESPDENLPSRITLEALKIKGIKGVHKVEIHKLRGETSVDLHLEIDAKATVKEAHDLVTEFEIRARNVLGIKEIHTHIETHECDIAVTEDITGNRQDLVRKVREIVTRYPRVRACHDIVIRKESGKLTVNMCCDLLENETMDRAHELSTMIERVVRKETGADHITIHIEPFSKG